MSCGSLYICEVQNQDRMKKGNNGKIKMRAIHCGWYGYSFTGMRKRSKLNIDD